MAKLEAAVVIGTAFRGDLRFWCFAWRPADNVDNAIEGVAAVHGSTGAANHFNAGRLFAVYIKKLVDVAEARAAQRDTVFSEVERATTSRACEHPGANRGEVFLTVAAAYPHPRRTAQ